MTHVHVKRIKVVEFIQNYFTGDKKPCKQTLVNHINQGRLSGQKIGSQWYVNVTAWGEPLHYGEPKTESVSIKPTGNTLADKILKRVA